MIVARRCPPLRRLLLTPLLLLASRALQAQVGSTTDILTGTVVGPDGKPLAGATVSATSTDTHITRSHDTNAAGRYTIVFPDGGGQYQVSARAVGFNPMGTLLSRQADEDRLVANFTLSSGIATLGTVTTRANRLRGPDPANAGGTGMTLSPSQIERLPIDGSDLATIAALAPGVVGISSTDTTATAFSVAGQRSSLNSTTVDGLTFNGTSVPQEATRSTRVITNSYDVSRGQFTGGQIATTTRGGTNDLSGSFAISARNPALAFGTDGPPAFGQLRNQYQVSGGIGGPIVKDKLFTFSAFQVSDKYDDLVSLLNATPGDLAQLGLSRDTVAQFLAKVHQLGLPYSAANVPAVRGTQSAVLFQRFDYLLSDDQTLTVRADYRATTQDGARISEFSLPTSGTSSGSSGGGVLVALTSHFGDATINDFRAYISHDQKSYDPYLTIPAGRVTVVPAVNPDSDDASAFGVSGLSFGGTSAEATRTFTDYVEGTDEVSILPGDGAHRIKLGALLNVARFGQSVSPDQEGTYSYESLSAFEADSPATFTRELNMQSTTAHGLNGAVYLGDAWRTQTLQVTYGARVEGSVYTGAPAEDPTIDSLFHRRTDQWPSEIHASPRVGFTWFAGGGGNSGNGGGGGGGGGPRTPIAIVRGGIGEFRAPIPQTLFPSAQSANGMAESQLECVGPQVPAPDWAGYADGSAAPPTTCAGTIPFPPDSLGLGARNAVTTFAPDFEAPRAWRGSLGASHRFGQVNVSVDGTYARGVALFGVTDLNLNTTPQFTIPNEANRPVFVPASAIDPATGTPAFGSSRIDPAYGSVLSLNSNLQSDTRQVTVSANGFTTHGLFYSGSYTYSRVRDQSSFGGGSAAYGFSSPTTAGNPNVVPWGTSDLQRENQFVGTLTYPVTALIEITAIAQVLSGAPYTPLVNGDINGDGAARNDRAFVFDPSTPGTDSAVASGMRTLLNSSSGRIRDCLLSQLGTIAGRNTCFGPWTMSLNWQVNIRPNGWGLERRLTISVQILNSLTGLDLLVHGPNHLAGWGQPAAPDATLLTVTGFNPGSREFTYAVNTHFGQPSANQTYGIPFQLVLAGRLNVGPSDVQQQLRGMFGGGGRGGGAGGGPGAPGGAPGAGGPPGGGAGQKESFADEIADRLTQRVQNPFDAVLKIKEALALTPTEITQVEASSQTFSVRMDSIVGDVRAELNKMGANIDMGSMAGVMRRHFAGIRDMLRAADDELQHELTPEQWLNVPDSIKDPARSAPGGARRGGGGRGGSP